MRIDTPEIVLPTCQACLGETWLKGRVRNVGTTAECHFCKTQGKCVSIAQLAKWVREILDEHFQACRNWSYYGDDDYFCHYEQKGEGLDQIVGDMIEADVPVIDAVLDELTVLPYSDSPDKPPTCYDRKTHYVEKRIRAQAFEGELANFRHELKHRSRLFNPYAKQFLDRLMQDIRDLPGLGKRKNSVIRTIQPDDTSLFYRARRADHPDHLEQILTTFKAQLGPPAPKQAMAGRMNTQGVSVFYGAFDRETCIAELHPPLGGTVVSAAFRLVKPLRLLDFPLLEKCYREQPLAYFQPDFTEKVSCRHVLRQLHAKIRQPSMPGDEEEYLLTQVFAEYLSAIVKPKIDGVIYASAQREAGLNVVLFGHVLDINFDAEHSAVMGANSALHICDNSARIHRVKAINYQFDHSRAEGGIVEWLLDPDNDF